MKIVVIGLFAASAALFGFADSARAVSIKNGDTPVFFDDFENQTVGSAPTTANISSAIAGATWASVAGSNGGTRNVTDAPQAAYPGAPGPYLSGSKYLLINRPQSNTGTTTATAGFTAFTLGQTIEIEFAYVLGAGGTGSAQDSGLLELQLLDSSASRIMWMDAGGVGGAFNFYDSTGNTVLTTTATLTQGANGQWHTFKLTYTQGSNDLTLWIDGASEAIMGAVADGDKDKLPQRLQFAPTRPGVLAIDAVPEPNAIVLAIASVIGLGVLRMGKRR